jgi:Kef-type K+ transport system membrane component KefB
VNGSPVVATALLGVDRTSDAIFLLVFGGIAVILVTARLVGAVFVRLGQPAVVGEVVGGVLLGPSVLGLLPGDPSALLFPPDIQPYLRIIAAFGLVIYMFIVGLELDPRTVRGERRAAISISLASISIPFLLGVLAGVLVHPSHDTAIPTGETEAVDVALLPFVLFCGLAICGSAFAILARILDERRLFRTRIGGVLLAAAVVDDLAVWMLASVVLAIAAGGEALKVLQTLGGLAAFVALLFIVVRPLLARLLSDRRGLTADVFAVVLVGLFASALFTTWLGISPILGAFFFGAAIPREGTVALFQQMNERLETVSVLVLLPVFFAVTGLGVDLSTFGLDEVVLILLFVVVATAGKLTGAAIAASLNGIRGRRAIAVGVLMNTRGLSELALLGIGRITGVLDTTMFTALVCTAILTTLASGPMLRLVYPDRLIDLDIAATERSRLAESSNYRVLVLVDDVERAAPAVDLAVELARSEQEAEVVLSRIERAGPRTELGSGFMGDLARMTSSMDELRQLLTSVQRRGVAAVPQSQFTDDVGRELVAQADRLHPHLVVVRSAADTDGDPARDELPELAARLNGAAQTDVLVVYGAPTDADPTLPVRIEEAPERHRTLAAEVGLRVAMAQHRPVLVPAGRRGHELEELAGRLGLTVLDPAVVDAAAPAITVRAGAIPPAGATGTGSASVDEAPVLVVHAHESPTGPRSLDRLAERLLPTE